MLVNMKISVITVCYNSVKTLEQTIKSVIAQNYDELEYIIIDGGSTDGTLDIIRKYNANITFWISESDHGLYDAMNKGLKVCTGEAVAFLNSDDWYDDNVLDRVNSFFEENDVDIVSGQTYSVRDGIIKKNVFARDNDENVFFKLMYHHPALFVKKKLFEMTGNYDITYKIAADTDWIMRAYSDGAKILKVDDYFTFFRHGGLSSRNVYETLKEQYKAALNCAQKHAKWELARRIKEYYSNVFKDVRRDIKVEDALSNHIVSVKQQFDLQKHYYIWGAGKRGNKCLEILERLKLPVDGFVDISDKAVVDGYLVISPNEIDTEHIVCITPKGHENEIQELLLQMGVSVNSILFYTDLLEKIAEFGEFQENTEVIRQGEIEINRE